MISPELVSYFDLPVIDYFDFSSVSDDGVSTTLHVVNLKLLLPPTEQLHNDVRVGKMKTPAVWVQRPTWYGSAV